MDFTQVLARERFADYSGLVADANEFCVVTANTRVNDMGFKLTTAFVDEQNDLRAVGKVHLNDTNVG